MICNETTDSSNSSLRSTIVFLVIALLVGGCESIQSLHELPTKTPKVVFIIVDGIPADVVESVPTPYLGQISGGRGYTRAYVGGAIGGQSESPTISAVGYNSLLTGTWANKHNVWDNDVANPNYRYWDIFRIAKAHDPSLRTAIFSTWEDNRTKLIGDGKTAAGGKKLDYYFDGLEKDTARFPEDEQGKYIKAIDELVADDAARYIASEGPDLSWVYLQYTDDVAHIYGDGPELTEAVKFADAQLGKIWAAVERREEKNAEDWMVLVTTDHGRDSETGKEHGGQTSRERATWIATNSRKLSYSYYQTPAIVDILPSIAAHLGLDIPPEVRNQIDGESFIDTQR